MTTRWAFADRSRKSTAAVPRLVRALEVYKNTSVYALNQQNEQSELQQTSTTIVDPEACAHDWRLEDRHYRHFGSKRPFCRRVVGVGRADSGCRKLLSAQKQAVNECQVAKLRPEINKNEHTMCSEGIHATSGGSMHGELAL